MHGDGPVPWLFEGEYLVRTVGQSVDPWFVAPDVCRTLGIKNVTDAVGRLDDDEKGLAEIETLGGLQKLNIVSEPGLYKLVSRSTKPVAKRFDRWVRHDVLPAIRKTGSYGPTLGEPPPIEHPRPFHEWSPADKNANCAIVSRYQQAMGPQVAQWSMEILGFPMPPEHLRSRQFELDLQASRFGEFS